MLKNIVIKFKNTKEILSWSILLLTIVFLINACSKDDDEPLQLFPNAGPSFIDIENDGYVVQLNAVPVKEPLTGTWRIYNGENGSFENVNDPKSKFYGEPGESYTLGWEIGNGNDYGAASITVSFVPLNPVIIAPTSTIDTLTNNVSAYLKAEEPKFGATGKWEIVNGTNGRIENSDNFKAEFIGKEKSDYKLQWTLSYGSKAVSTEVSFVTDVLNADAGPDQLDVKNLKEETDKYFSLEAYLPAGATAVWEIVENKSSATIYDTNNPNSLIKGIEDTTYTLKWKVELDEYTSIDSVAIRFRGKWGVWKDSRDNQTYKFAEINGLEWMSENYNYAADPGNGSWYYGHAYRAVIEEGYPLETPDDRKKYGRVYTYLTAADYAPEGWRLPTGEEMYNLIVSQGGTLYAKDKLTTGGKTGFDLNYPGYLEFSSFSDPAFRNVFRGQDKTALYWTNDYNEFNGAAVAIATSINGESIDSTVLFESYYALPVRYVREIQN
ncbi:major paralogous domain-containing protein [Lutibacter agarilyticus]|uniref:Major paralogous domain-containing protein n=1 Tax=Lutibacter agarilyticus TaxID=1109740 RepID=A0A238YPP4_9FLAO|nr:FISUMP domain-containing protein [Lutibacter agarilyticus]SNR72563.1 major paralogous domain-containing protein [Lutibacter agarilyticus]